MVYDPRAGLLTATGQVEDSTAFATVAKYLTTDSTEPFGEFAISAPTAGGERLTFATTSLEWLVITPDGKSAVKGTAGEYGFVAYATPDGFRGVVWPLSAGPIPPAGLLYDTSPGAGYDVDVAEPKPLTTGAVVIDSGWVPGLPLPLGEVPDVLTELIAVLGEDCLVSRSVAAERITNSPRRSGSAAEVRPGQPVGGKRRTDRISSSMAVSSRSGRAILATSHSHSDRAAAARVPGRCRPARTPRR